MGGAKPLNSHPPLLSPADSSAQFEMGTQAYHAPPVRPWNQVSVAQYTQTPLRAASQREPPELCPCIPPRCPTAGTPVVPLVPLVQSLRAWLALPSPSRWLIRTIRLSYAIQFARRPPKFRGVHFTSVKAVDTHVLRAEIAVLLAKDAIELVPPADMRSGFYSPDFIVPKKNGGLRPILDLRVLNRSLHKLPFKCIRPRDWFAAIDLKDAYLLDSSSTQAVSALCVRGSSISVQDPTLRAGPVSPHLHESRGGSPCSHERTGRPHPQLSRRLAHSRSVSGTVMRTQGFGAQSPQPVGSSGQLGKEQTRPSAEDLFSRYGVGFGRTVSTPHRGTCSVGVELPEYIQGQDSGPTETFSEAPGPYGGRSGSNPARLASYETASALASWPSPEMGVATRHVPSGNHSGMPPNLQPVVRPLLSSGRSSPRAGVPACCSLHGCLCHRLGGHVQRTGSVRGV